MKDSYIGQAWLVLSLSLVFGGLLAGVQAALGPKIEENKRNETYDQIPDLVTLRKSEAGAEWAPAADGKIVSKVFDAAGDHVGWVIEVPDDGKIAYKVFDAGGDHVGWVIKGAGSGFADRIELLIGLTADAERILGMYVLDQKETPALGDGISEPDFQGRFRDKTTSARLEVVRTVTDASPGNNIQAVTGATVSSESVCKIVNKAVDEFKPWLDDYAAAQAEPADQTDPEED